ncbi:MAG: ABC transporter permease subunit [Fimbriimonadaceae bacterium]
MMGPILAIAKTTVGEAIRRRVLLVILMIGVLLLSIIPSLGVLTARQEKAVMISTMFAVLRATSALIAIILTIYMIPNEIERRTIYTILSKPVQRWQFLVGKYLGAVFALFIMIAMMSAVMIILYKVFHNPDMASLLDVAKQPINYFMEMSLLSALSIFISTFAPPLVNFFLSFGLWGVGTVLNPLYDSVAQNSGTGPIMKGVATIATKVLPNFAQYDIKNPIINPETIIENPQMYTIYITGYAIVYITFLLIGGMLIFEKREV